MQGTSSQQTTATADAGCDKNNRRSPSFCLQPRPLFLHVSVSFSLSLVLLVCALSFSLFLCCPCFLPLLLFDRLSCLPDLDDAGTKCCGTRKEQTTYHRTTRRPTTIDQNRRLSAHCSKKSGQLSQELPCPSVSFSLFFPNSVPPPSEVTAKTDRCLSLLQHIQQTVSATWSKQTSQLGTALKGAADSGSQPA